MKRNLIALLILTFIVVQAKSGVVIIDSETSTPLPKASLFDRNGQFIGVASDEGVIPESINPDLYPLNVRYVGYNPVEVANPNAGTIMMTEEVFTLPEVTIDEQSRNLLYITAYVRELASGSTDNDTILQFTDGIVDFVIPIGKKAKFKGWNKPRILAEKTYERRKSAEIDTLRFKLTTEGKHPGFNFKEKFEVPQPIVAGNSIKEVFPGKYSTESEWKVIGDNIYLFQDELADHKDHKFSLNLGILKGSQTLDEYNYKFQKSQKEVLTAEDIITASYLFDLSMGGFLMKKATSSKEPLMLKIYCELFIIDRAYLTADEAKELKKNKPVIDLRTYRIPENLPMVPAAYSDLKAKVLEAKPNAF